MIKIILKFSLNDFSSCNYSVPSDSFLNGIWCIACSAMAAIDKDGYGFDEIIEPSII